MRPVTRNAPVHYNNTGPFTIPDTYQGALTQNGCPVIANSGHNGNHNYTLANIRIFMSNMAYRINTNPQGLTVPQTQALNYLQINIFTNQQNTSYKNAKLDLINNFGQFCNYCGVRINDYSLAVEHCLPESEFYDEMMNYENFLLACPECNSSNKKANPTYLNAQNWAIAGGILAPNYNQIKQYAVNYYSWPTYIINAPAFANPGWGNYQNAYSGFIAQYWCGYNGPGPGGGPNPVAWPFNNQINLNGIITYVNNSLTGITNGLVNGQVSCPPPLPLPPPPLPLNSQFGVKFDYVPFQPPMYMVNLVGLNNYAPNNLHASDRRVFNRTIVWFHACNAFNQIEQILNIQVQAPIVPPNPAGPGIPQAQITALLQIAQQQMYATASESGFWEVWADLIIKKGGAPAGNQIYQNFRAATIQNNNYFPGTDPNFIP